MPSEDWNTARLDDMHREVESTTRVLYERVLPGIRDIEKDMKRMAATGDRRSQRRWDVVVLVIGQIATVAAVLIDLIHH